MRPLRFVLPTALVMLLTVAPPALAVDFCAENPNLCGPTDDDDSQGGSVPDGNEEIEGGGEAGSDGSDESFDGTVSEPGEPGTSEQGSTGTSGRVVEPSGSNTSGNTSGSGTSRRSSSRTSSGVDPSPSPSPSLSPTPSPSPSPEPSPSPTDDLAGALEVEPASDESMLPFYIMLIAIAALMFVYLRGRKKYRGGARSRGRSPRSLR